ncbi:MAG: N-acetylmuramoyl-L-alanine amidase [Gemmatimonadota bacterium]|nr:N-acetylmuramoyl-L-alanine amidase [Gemmatimonadota bacterium]
MPEYFSSIKTNIFICLLFCFFSLAPSQAYCAHDNGESSGAGSHFTVRMGSSLWETLIDCGVNPTQWKMVFAYNRANNPSFKKIRSARSIPKGTAIYIPVDSDTRNRFSRSTRSRSSRTSVEDTVHLIDNIPFLLVKAGYRQNLSDIIKKYCLPLSIREKRSRDITLRSIRSDVRDLYRRMDRDLKYRDTKYYLPLHLTAEQHDSLRRRVSSFFSSPDDYVPLDSLLKPLGSDDTRHVASQGESYRTLAERYTGSLSEFPDHYCFLVSRKKHLDYMAQHIRHYNMNQPLWPGKTYVIPGYLLGGRYFQENPRIKLRRKTRKALYYENGLEVSLEYHVTRRKPYWKRRERYYPPLKRVLEDGGPAYPDMLMWHRTGLDPEIEKILRAKGRSHFSLRYIYRTAVANYYIDELGACFLVVDPEKNPRDHAGNPVDYRCFWNGQNRVSDVSISIEVEGGFFGDLSASQLETAGKLQEMLRGRFIIPDERVLDHRKVSCRRGTNQRLLRGRKADGLTSSDRLALGIKAIPDPDVLRGIVDANLDIIQMRQVDSTDYWYGIRIDPDLESSARLTGWQLVDGLWQRPPSHAAEKEAYPSSF